MSTAARFLVVIAMTALIAGWFLWQKDAGLHEPAVMQANEPAVVTPVVPPVPVIPTRATEDSAADLSRSQHETPDEEMVALVRRMADRMNKTAGAQLVEHLVSKGLSSADSERAVADVMPDWVRCQIDGTLAQAEERSISRAAALAVINASGLFAGPPGMDMNAAVIRAQPCRFSVQQRLGIFPGEFGFRAIPAGH
jgi:hypothetical protein